MACQFPAEPAQHQPPAVKETASSPTPPIGPPTDQIAGSNATNNIGTSNAVPAAAAVADPVCPACLGVLQTPEGVVHAVPAAMLAGLPEAEANAGSWQTCTSGSCEALARCIRSERVMLLLLCLQCSMQASNLFSRPESACVGTNAEAANLKAGPGWASELAIHTATSTHKMSCYVCHVVYTFIFVFSMIPNCIYIA